MMYMSRKPVERLIDECKASNMVECLIWREVITQLRTGSTQDLNYKYKRNIIEGKDKLHQPTKINLKKLYLAWKRK